MSHARACVCMFMFAYLLQDIQVPAGLLMVVVEVGLLGGARLIHLQVLDRVGVVQSQRLKSHARGSAQGAAAAAEVHVVVVVLVVVAEVIVLVVVVGDDDGRGSEADCGAADDGLRIDAQLP